VSIPLKFKTRCIKPSAPENAVAVLARDIPFCILMQCLVSLTASIAIKYSELNHVKSRFFETVTLPARVRLFHLLMILREHYGRIVDDGSLFLELQLTRGDIASMLGIMAELLSRLIRKIEAENLAHFSGNKITIANPDSLIKELDAGLHSF